MIAKRSIPAVFTLAALLVIGTFDWWARPVTPAESSAGVPGQIARRSAISPAAAGRREVPHPRSALDAEGKSRQRNFEPLQALVRKDPDAAARQAPGLGLDAVVALTAAWAERDVAAVARWAKSLEGEARDSALGTLASELASGNLRLAMELALAMEAGVARNETVAFVAAQFAAEDPEEALRWTRELGDADLRTTVEGRVLPAVASLDPEKAARYMAEEMDGSPVQAIVAVEVLQRWVQTDPEAAAAWVEEFSAAEFRVQGLDALLRVWETRNAAALEAWWRDQPAGAFREEVAAAMAGILAQTNRTSALNYVDGITVEELRAKARERALAP